MVCLLFRFYHVPLPEKCNITFAKKQTNVLVLHPVQCIFEDNMSGPKIVIQMCIQHRSTSMLNSYAENAFSFAERFHITASKVLLVLSQLIILNKFCEAIDSGKEIRAVFCDISKVFDTVWHKGLLQKLKYDFLYETLVSLSYSSEIDDRRWTLIQVARVCPNKLTCLREVKFIYH